MDDISVALLRRFDEIYQRLRSETYEVLIPNREVLEGSVKRSSFRLFQTTADYLANVRAGEYPHCISSAFGDRTFRVYLNTFSSKVYVDVNRDRYAPIRHSVESEVQIFCEITRAILFIDPIHADSPGEGPSEIEVAVIEKV